MNQPEHSNPALLDKVYQQLAEEGSIQHARLLEIAHKDKAAAKAMYEDMQRAGIVAPSEATAAADNSDLPANLVLTEFGMTFLISRGYTLRP